jgi:hypothetical protein
LGKIIRVCLIAIFLSGWFCAPPHHVFAKADTLVRLEPATVGLRPGEQATVVVRVENVASLYGLEFHLQFDPKFIEIIDANPDKADVQIGEGDFLKGGFVAVNRADNKTGAIDFAVTLLNPAGPVDGSGVIASITIKALAEGTSPLKIVQAILATRDATEIHSLWQDGAVQISGSGKTPEPTILSMVEAALPLGATLIATQEVVKPQASASPLQEFGTIACGGMALLLGATFFLLVRLRKRK